MSGLQPLVQAHNSPNKQGAEHWALQLPLLHEGLWQWQTGLAPEQGWLLLSPQAQTLLGLSLPEKPTLNTTIAETVFWLHIHPEDREGAQCILAGYLQNHANQLEITFRRNQPQTQWLQLKGQRSPQGKSLLIGSLMDVTAQQALQTQLIEAYESLEQAYRKQMSLQKRLFETQKLESMVRLAAGVAHELNNPLAFVKANLQALQRYSQGFTHLLPLLGPLQAKQALQIKLIPELLEEMAEGLERINAIAGQLKHCGQPAYQQANPLTPNHGFTVASPCSWLEPNALIKSMVRFTKIPLAHCQLKLELEENLPLFYGEAIGLGQVILNLLNNAALATPKDGCITVSSAIKTPAGPYEKTETPAQELIICITDTGCGIAPEHADKILEPFYTTRCAEEGTGLGLAIAYDVIRRHGGNLSFESTLGQGSCFKICLPLVKAPTEASLC